MMILPEDPYACEECGQPLQTDGEKDEAYEGRCTNENCRLQGVDIAILDPHLRKK